MNPQQTPGNDRNNPNIQSESRQEQTDPQLTELKGLTDGSEELEPRLTDGTKAPDKEADKRASDDTVR